MKGSTLEFQGLEAREAGLVVYMRIRGPENSWVQFASLPIPYDQIERGTWGDVGHHVDRAQREQEQQETLL